MAHVGFLWVFQVMSGSVAPSSVGPNDERDIRQLLKFKPVFKILHRPYKLFNSIVAKRSTDSHYRIHKYRPSHKKLNGTGGGAHLIR